MELSEQKMVLERFLEHHGIEMSATARLAHYGRRFSAYFPELAALANPMKKAWTSRLIQALAVRVQMLEPGDFVKDPGARPVDVPAKRRDMNKTKAFLLSREWRETRFDVLRQHGPRCQLCGATSAEQRIEVDHIQPISKRWDLRLDRANLQVLCRDCNKGKGNRVVADFR